MDWQTIIVAIIGVVALLAVIRKFYRQFFKPESAPECDNCPVPDIQKKNSQS